MSKKAVGVIVFLLLLIVLLFIVYSYGYLNMQTANVVGKTVEVKVGEIANPALFPYFQHIP